MVSKIPLTQGKVALVDSCNLEFLSQFSWSAFEDTRTWYAQCWYPPQKKNVRMHRLIMRFPELKVDHRDGNGLNNTIENLRLTDNFGNARNARAHGSTSQYKGVCWHTRDLHWRAQITVNYKKIALGAFGSEVEAAMAYDIAALRHFREFAKTNFPVTSKKQNQQLIICENKMT